MTFVPNKHSLIAFLSQNLAIIGSLGYRASTFSLLGLHRHKGRRGRYWNCESNTKLYSIHSFSTGPVCPCGSAAQEGKMGRRDSLKTPCLSSMNQWSRVARVDWSDDWAQVQVREDTIQKICWTANCKVWFWVNLWLIKPQSVSYKGHICKIMTQWLNANGDFESIHNYRIVNYTRSSSSCITAFTDGSWLFCVWPCESCDS